MVNLITYHLSFEYNGIYCTNPISNHRKLLAT